MRHMIRCVVINTEVLEHLIHLAHTFLYGREYTWLREAENILEEAIAAGYISIFNRESTHNAEPIGSDW